MKDYYEDTRDLGTPDHNGGASSGRKADLRENWEGP